MSNSLIIITQKGSNLPQNIENILMNALLMIVLIIYIIHFKFGHISLNDDRLIPTESF